MRVDTDRNILVWSVLGSTALLIVVSGVLFTRYFLISKWLVEERIKWRKDYVVQMDGVKIKEVDGQPPLELSPFERRDYDGNILNFYNANKKMLRPSGKLEDRDPPGVKEVNGKPTLLADSNGEMVKFFKPKDDRNALVCKNDGLFETVDNKIISKKIISFERFFINHVSELVEVTDKDLLMVAFSKGSRNLYHIRLDTNEISLISKKVYDTFKEPSFEPRIFKIPEIDGFVVAYFKGRHTFAFLARDGMRPDRTVVRVFNPRFQHGIDVAQINFKGGLIFDVKYSEGHFLLKGDPSRPTIVKDFSRPIRVWSMSVPAIK